MVDLDLANEGVDDLAFAQPVELIDALGNFGRKVLKSIDHQRQLTIRIGNIECFLTLLIKLRHALLQSVDARLKFVFVDQACGV